MMNYYILIISLIILLILLQIYHYFKYKKLFTNYKNFEQDVHNKYIKTDVRIKNAVCEAYEYAEKEHRAFEAKIFSELLEEIKTKV